MSTKQLLLIMSSFQNQNPSIQYSIFEVRTLQCGSTFHIFHNVISDYPYCIRYLYITIFNFNNPLPCGLYQTDIFQFKCPLSFLLIFVFSFSTYRINWMVNYLALRQQCRESSVHSIFTFYYNLSRSILVVCFFVSI